MNPDADPKLEALFAAPMREVLDDSRAVEALLARLERSDRRRGLILTAAGTVGAVLAMGVIGLTEGMPAWVAGVSTLAMRWSTALAGMKASWNLPVPQGSVALALGVLALCGAGAFALRTRT